jgi:hypothetical protein
MRRTLVLVLVGGLVAAFVQPFTPTGWWLNSSWGVAVTSAALALTAIAVRFRTRSVRNQAVAASAALWFGANIGFAVVLFRSGPGTLFPIVLIIGAGIAAVAVGAGSLMGAIVSGGATPRSN